MAIMPRGVEIILQAARRVERILIRDFSRAESLQVSLKGTADFVTKTDMICEEKIVMFLQDYFPNYGFLLEEQEEIIGENTEYRFIIDPIDGTYNFMHSFPYFATSIALEQNLNNKREIIAAVIHAPILKETFWAAKGRGGYIEDGASMHKKLKVSKNFLLSRSLISVGSIFPSKDSSYRHILNLKNKGAHLRSLGSIALEMAYVAAGRLDATVHSRANAWDLAAGYLLVKEAGGVVADLDDENEMFTKHELIASNNALYKVLQSIVGNNKNNTKID